MIRRILIYGFAIFIAIAALSEAYWRWVYIKPESQQVFGNLYNKTAFYKREAETFDLVFLGDSRTYCAMHPDVIDPILKTRSFNLSYWSNWFPSQHAMLRDVIDDIPQNTHIVWSIGHQNFKDYQINKVYPFTLQDMLPLMGSAYSASELSKVYVDSTSWLQLLSIRETIYQKITGILERPLQTPSLANAGNNSIAAYNTQGAQAPIRTPSESPLYNSVTQSWLEGSTVVSVEDVKDNGAYLRTELVPQFYRNKQREKRLKLLSGEAPSDSEFKVSPTQWSLFIRMLELFESRNIKVTINVFEEAPHMYIDEAFHQSVRDFMLKDVNDEIKKRGFQMIYVDFEQLHDAHYFDYNHLNSQGVMEFTRLFTEQFQQL